MKTFQIAASLVKPLQVGRAICLRATPQDVDFPQLGKVYVHNHYCADSRVFLPNTWKVVLPLLSASCK